MTNTIRDLFVLFDGTLSDAVDHFRGTSPSDLHHLFRQPPPDGYSHPRRWSFRNRWKGEAAGQLFGISPDTPLFYRIVVLSRTRLNLRVTDEGYSATFLLRVSNSREASSHLDADLELELRARTREMLGADTKDSKSEAPYRLWATLANSEIFGVFFALIGIDIDGAPGKSRADESRLLARPQTALRDAYLESDDVELFAGKGGLASYASNVEDNEARNAARIEFLRRLASSGYLEDSELSSLLSTLYATSPRITLVEQNGAVWTSGTAEQGEQLRSALQELLQGNEIELTEDGPAYSGSWWQRFKVAVKMTAEQQDLPGKLGEVEQGLRAHFLDNQTAQNDNLKADAASKLLAQLADVDEAVIVLGQLVIVKHEKKLVIKCIDAITAAEIEGRHTLLSDPAAVIRMLSTIGSEEPQPSIYAQQARAALQQPPEPPQIDPS